jgi:hypothetical protein
MTTIKSSAFGGALTVDVLPRSDGRVNLQIRAGFNSIGIQIPTADLLAALGVDPDWREKVNELGETLASVDNWRQEAGIQTRRADAAEAKLAEAERTLTELAPAEVCVEGSWFKPADLPAVLGNYMRSLTESQRREKEGRIRTEAAEAKLARVEVALDNGDALAIRAALADPEPFVLPTEAGVRFEATRVGGNAGNRTTFKTITDGADVAFYLAEDENGPGTDYIWDAERIMNTHLWVDHRLIESGADE